MAVVMMKNVIIIYILHHLIKSFNFTLSLAENAISNKGAKALSRALFVNRTLTSLK